MGPPPGGSRKLTGASGLTWEPCRGGKKTWPPQGAPGGPVTLSRDPQPPQAGGVQTGLFSHGLQWALSVWTRSAQSSGPPQDWSSQAASPSVRLRMGSCSVSAPSWSPSAPAIRSLLSIFQFSSVAQSCLTLRDPMDCSTPGFPVLHHLPEFTQTHVHQVGDAIQPSHPLSSPSPPAFNLSQISDFSNESFLLIRWPKYWSFSFSISPSNEY